MDDRNPTNDPLTITIKDNGPGFFGGRQELLYQRFKKLSARPTAGESSKRVRAGDR